MLIGCVVTTQLICAFVFAYADCLFSDAAAHFLLLSLLFVVVLFGAYCVVVLVIY